MRRLLHIERHQNGPRVYVGGQRLHHGATGTLLLLAGRRRAIRIVGLLLCAHDRHDLRVWFVRERTPALDHPNIAR